MSKKILYFLIFIVLNTTLSSTPINDLNIYPRIALIIGNSDYPQWGELNNPIKDATDIKKLLESRGFDVLYSTNTKRKEFERLLIEFRNRLRENQNSIGLFYFSGHGMEIEGSNYLIPVDSVSAQRYDNIELNKIIRDMESSNNQLDIIILDSCRDNPFINSFRSFNKRGGFKKIESIPRGLFISYATEPGKVAEDGEKGENGLFTKYLLFYMQQPLDLYHVFKKTREAVFNASDENEKQLPTISDQTIGDDFYFTKPKLRATPTPVVKPQVVDRIVYRDRPQPVVTPIHTTPQPQINTPQTKGKWNPLIYRGKRSYSKNSTNTVKDNYTGLIWQKKDDGINNRDWEDAKRYCSNLSLDGYSDWRLPTMEELYYLSDITKIEATFDSKFNYKRKPAIDTNYFDITNSRYWSSTTYKPISSDIWIFNFEDGDDGWTDKSNKHWAFTLCVR